MQITLFTSTLRALVTATLVLAGQSSVANAGIVPSDYREPAADAEYGRMIAEHTTDAAFLSPLTATIPAHDSIPSPLEFLGYIIGEPHKLTYYSEIKAYMESLADASDRVLVHTIGQSNEGHDMIAVVIANEAIIDRLDEYQDFTRRLADPRATSEADATEIVERAVPFYYLTGGLHSAEPASPETLMELAYRLAASESPLAQRIRNNVVTVITPVVDIDGHERIVDWYYNVTIDHEDWNNMPQRYPPYWGKYVLHDSNRDGLQLTQPLSRHMLDAFFEYHPQVMHDLHESVPLLYVSSGTGPYNDSLDPIATSEWQVLSNTELTEMSTLGMPGVWTWGFYTGWWPGYLIWMANNHNSLGRFYETFGNAGASTFERELKSKFAGEEVTTKQWYRPWPPEKKVQWSLRNNVNYTESAVLIALDHVAQNRKSFLFNFWKKGFNSLQRGKTQAPYAWVIPAGRGQSAGDPPRYEFSRLVETLQAQRIELHRLTGDVSIGEREYKEGDIVVRMDQPYRDFAKSLLERQKFPDTAEYRPYDDVAWTLPLLYGVPADRVDDEGILDADMERIETQPAIATDAPKKRTHYIIPASPSSRYLAARFRLRDFTVLAADTAFTFRDRDFPRGTWLLPGDAGQPLHDAVSWVARELGLDVLATKSLPDVTRHELDVPRIAVYHTWMFTQDSGWVRYALDADQIPYTLIDKDDVRAGMLRDEFDVIVIPSTGGHIRAKDLLHGIDTQWSPLPYKRTEETPHLGAVDSSDDITGGIGFGGLAEIERFVDKGGTLITLGAASIIPVELGLVRHIDRIHPGGFSNPGSVVRTSVVDGKNNFTAGYGDHPSVFRGNLPLFKVADNYSRYAVLVYGDAPHDDDAKDNGDAKKEPLCLSGSIKGEQHLNGKPAILDVPRGLGRVVIFSFNPMHRHLTLSTFGMVYNAILNWND